MIGRGTHGSPDGSRSGWNTRIAMIRRPSSAARQSASCISTVCRPRKLLITGLNATASGPLGCVELAAPNRRRRTPRPASRRRAAPSRSDKMMASRADPSRRLRQPHVRRAQHRPSIAVAERCQAFDLPHRLVRQRRERRFGIDKQLGDTIVLRDRPLAYAQKSRRNASIALFVDRETRPPLRVRRAQSRCCPHAASAACRLNPATLRPDPTPGFAPSSSSEIKHHWADGASPPAAPPRCQSRPDASRGRPAQSPAHSCGSHVSSACLFAARVHAPLQRLPLVVEAVNELGQLRRPLRDRPSSAVRSPAAPAPIGPPHSAAVRS